MKEEKCEFCGCRGEDTICYYNCGCHKPDDKEVLPKKWHLLIIMILQQVLPSYPFTFPEPEYKIKMKTFKKGLAQEINLWQIKNLP